MTTAAALSLIDEAPALGVNNFPPYATLASAYRELYDAAKTLAAAVRPVSSREAEVALSALLREEAQDSGVARAESYSDAFKFGYLCSYIATHATAALMDDVQARLAVLEARRGPTPHAKA